MKMFYICDCCDEVYDMVDLANHVLEKEQGLTGQNGYDIINREVENDNNYYVYSICPACREDIQGETKTLFSREPLIN